MHILHLNLRSKNTEEKPTVLIIKHFRVLGFSV